MSGTFPTGGASRVFLGCSVDIVLAGAGSSTPPTNSEMGRRWRSRDQESEVEGEDGAGEAVIFPSSDDEEANEDLTLAVVAKARLREAKRKRSKDKEKGRALFIDLCTSSDNEIEAVPNGKAAVGREFVAGAEEEVKKKRKNRPKKKKKKEVKKEEQPDAPAEEKEPAGISDPVIEVGNEASNNLVLRKLLRGPRYFDPSHGNWETTCYNCGQEGHIAANCNEERRQKPCFVCGMFGHNAKNCMQGQDCFICKRRGHHAKECPDKHKNNSEVSVICLHCGDLGHDMAFCRKDYASSDIKEIQCYICKKYGHLCCVDYKDNGPIEISCYNCAEFGHTGQGCAKQRCESTTVTPPTLCYRCGLEGHFARGCTKNHKSIKRLGELSTPVSRLKVKKDAKVSKSLPRDFGREHKKKSSYFDKGMQTVKSKIKGGWIVDDTSYLPKSKHKIKNWVSPTTASGRTKFQSSSWVSPTTASGRIKFQSSSSGHRYFGYSSPQTPHQRYKCYVGTPISRGSTGGYHHGYSVSRFGYSQDFYG